MIGIGPDGIVHRSKSWGLGLGLGLGLGARSLRVRGYGLWAMARARARVGARAVAWLVLGVTLPFSDPVLRVVMVLAVRLVVSNFNITQIVDFSTLLVASSSGLRFY